MENLLPPYCYRQAPIDMRGIVIHYFSTINVDPDNKFDLGSNWKLMHDLNVKKEDRFWYLLGDNDPDKRMYASAHCFIGREGEHNILVPEASQAYHAGVSKFKGFTNWNKWSYGIELIGTHNSGFTDKQYRTCANVCAQLMKEYDIPIDMIVGHEEIAPGRKKDPGIATGNFDMDRLKASIYAISR